MSKDIMKDILRRRSAYIVDSIYEEFENRTCRTCEYYIHTIEEWSCGNIKSILYSYEYALERDETCNKWEKKCGNQ